MAKKSAARNSGAARRPQTTVKHPVRQVTLVRTPEMVAAGAAGAASATPATENVTPSGSASATTGARIAAKPATGSAARVATPTKAATPAPKPAARPSAPATSPAPRGAQASRAARAQAVQRARTVHLISAENYSYVINDLKLTGILAAAMFFVILVLHFIIG
jgi:hypothetical protein